MTVTLCLSCSLGLLNRRPWGPLCWVLGAGFFIASYQHLLWTPTHQGQKAPSAWCGFPYHISSPTGCISTGTASTELNCQLPLPLPLPTSTGTRTQLRYIIIQRPHDRPLDLWNRMFNRHQAEITVMQFTGHSLPVHHSVVAPWDLHLVPYYKP